MPFRILGRRRNDCPAYNHTREDSPLLPCPKCASSPAEKELAEMLLQERRRLSEANETIKVTQEAFAKMKAERDSLNRVNDNLHTEVARLKNDVVRVSRESNHAQATRGARERELEALLRSARDMVNYFTIKYQLEGEPRTPERRIGIADLREKIDEVLRT